MIVPLMQRVTFPCVFLAWQYTCDNSLCISSSSVYCQMLVDAMPYEECVHIMLLVAHSSAIGNMVLRTAQYILLCCLIAHCRTHPESFQFHPSLKEGKFFFAFTKLSYTYSDMFWFIVVGHLQIDCARIYIED
jgi:hypothetical protein